MTRSDYETVRRLQEKSELSDEEKSRLRAAYQRELNRTMDAYGYDEDEAKKHLDLQPPQSDVPGASVVD